MFNSHYTMEAEPFRFHEPHIYHNPDEDSPEAMSKLASEHWWLKQRTQQSRRQPSLILPQDHQNLIHYQQEVGIAREGPAAAKFLAQFIGFLEDPSDWPTTRLLDLEPEEATEAEPVSGPQQQTDGPTKNIRSDNNNPGPGPTSNTSSRTDRRVGTQQHHSDSGSRQQDAFATAMQFSQIIRHHAAIAGLPVSLPVVPRGYGSQSQQPPVNSSGSKCLSTSQQRPSPYPVTQDSQPGSAYPRSRQATQGATLGWMPPTCQTQQVGARCSLLITDRFLDP
ncbi:hypothetical protein C8J56DRAFT_592429 [Mycena floridula]|nr:hypothetical protein C8J56DRAFT_592429 [Mycena floridula]